MAENRPVKICETVLRDAHQSLIATRMTTEQMLPIVDQMEQRGVIGPYEGAKPRKVLITKEQLMEKEAGEE